MERIARKDHLCDYCNLRILRGRPYADEETSVYAGRKITRHRRLHLPCRDARNLETRQRIDKGEAALREGLRQAGVDI